jgi:hypothetical protein
MTMDSIVGGGCGTDLTEVAVVGLLVLKILFVSVMTRICLLFEII